MKDLENIINQNTNQSSSFNALKTPLNASVVSNSDNMQELLVDDTLGKGYVKRTNFKNGLSVIQFDIDFAEDHQFLLNKSDCIYFVYVLEGSCFFSNSSQKSKTTSVEELRPLVTTTDTNSTSEILIKKDKKFICSLISIDKSIFFDMIETSYNVSKKVSKKFKNAFSNLKHHFRLCGFSLKIADELSLIKTKNDGFKVMHMLYLESHYKIIFALHLEEFYNEVYNERIISPLTKTELQKIRKITEYIIENPMLKHTIKSLCNAAILSPVKLQEGFRCIHGHTVSNYIRHVRVEKARDLLIYSDHNVSEVAYMVGFTSRSYFCKIFKEKYGCNATAYRDKYKDQTIEVNDI